MIYEALGMSEFSTFISFGPNIPPRPGSVGKIQKGRNVTILPIDGGVEPVTTNQIGMLAIHRANNGFMKTYFKRDQEFQDQLRGDWFLSGDLVYQDEDGYIWYIDRCDNILNINGGHRVSPIEIELALNKCPWIEKAICHYGKYNEVENYLQATIKPSNLESDSLSYAENIQHWCKKNLSKNKTPKIYRFIKQFPKKANGKIDRKSVPQIDKESPCYFIQ